jgi:hypothetical protein
MRQTLTRLGWFTGLWAAGVVACGALAFIIRAWLN